MPAIVVNNDVTTGYGTCSPINAVATSLVTINNKKIVLMNDSYTMHCGRTPTIVATSSVTINGKKVALNGDKLSDGDTATASSTVIIT